MVKLNEERMRKILSCRICFNLVDDATVFNQCIHPFCWKCINEKIAQGDFKCCPFCKADVGPDPVKRLRPAQHIELLMHWLACCEDEEEDEEMEEGSTEYETESSEGSETESSVLSSIDMVDVKPLVPIKAEEDDKKFVMKTEIDESSVKIESPYVSQNGVVVRNAVKLEDVKLERDNDLMAVGSGATSFAVDRKAVLPVKKEETQW